MVEDDPLPRTVRKFLRSLARQLRTSGELSDAARSTLTSTSYLDKVLDGFVDDLPAGKLRSALLQCLQEQQKLIVGALQQELLAAAASNHEEQQQKGKNGAPMQVDKWRRRLYDLLSGWCKEPELLNLPKAQVRLAWASCNAPVSVLWALAALELRGTIVQDAIDAQHPSVLPARYLLDRLKLLVIGHASSSHATATLLPLVPIILHMLQGYMKHLQVLDKPPTQSHAIKALTTLKAIVQEVLGLILVLMKHSRHDALAKRLHCSALLDGFYLLLEALDVHRDAGEWEALPNLERLKIIAPLVSERTLKSMHISKQVKVVSMSRIASVEFVLLQLILELLLCREASEEHLLESLRKIAIHGVAVTEHGDDLILDLLLSNLSVADFLEDKEKSLIQLALFQALLIKGQSSIEKSSDKVSKNQQKDLGAFFKRLAVARNLILTDRLTGVQTMLEDLVYKLHVPPQALEWVKAAKLPIQPPARASTSSRCLIGWLLNVEREDVDAILDHVKQDQRRNHGGAISSPERPAKQSHPLVTGTRSDSFFFFDTSGAAVDEEEAAGIGLSAANDAVNGKHTPASTKGKKKSKRKRKREQVLFHGHRQVMLAEDQGMSAVLSAEASSSSSQED